MLFYKEVTNLLHFTINVRIFHRKYQDNLQLACEDCLLFVLSLSSRPFILAAASKMRAGNSSGVSILLL
jgi:hypothetical protein